MSVAIQWGYFDDPNNPPLTQGFIYMDATTQLRKTLNGSVTKHPIDGGGNIVDHFTRENPIITFSGIISGVDISAKNRNIADPNGNTPTNLRPVPYAVKVNSSGRQLLNILPESITQFFKPSRPDISPLAQSSETLKTIQENLESLFADGQVQLVTLYEYHNNTLKREPLTNLVMTSLVFTDTPETGNALTCDITLEQVTFTQSKKGQIPKGIRAALVSQDLQTKAAQTNDKGKQDSTVNGVDRVETTDQGETILYSSGGSIVRASEEVFEGVTGGN